eukprot:m.8263 g.8263  ORF g.8263 m.8263 type:complete len:220 (+) comp4042_c0_seq1:1817-2476(+)
MSATTYPSIEPADRFLLLPCVLWGSSINERTAITVEPNRAPTTVGCKASKESAGWNQWVATRSARLDHCTCAGVETDVRNSERYRATTDHAAECWCTIAVAQDTAVPTLTLVCAPTPSASPARKFLGTAVSSWVGSHGSYSTFRSAAETDALKPSRESFPARVSAIAWRRVRITVFRRAGVGSYSPSLAGCTEKILMACNSKCHLVSRQNNTVTLSARG